MSIIGRMVKRFIVAPRVRKLTWEQLCAAGAVSRERFEAQIADETEESASVSARGAMSVKDTLAHLTVANRGIAARLEGLRTGQSMDSRSPDLFPGANGKMLDQVKSEHGESWRQLAEKAASPIDSSATAPHQFFGPMTASEWVAAIAVHYEYHSRRIDRVKQSEEYRQSLKATW